MPTDFAYMTSSKNLRSILDKIRGAGTPPRFSLEFLKTLGYGSSTDRPVIGVLKALRFLASDGIPIERYNIYRDSSRSGQAMAAGLHEGWADVFLADQKAYERSSAQLVELFKSVSGKGDAVAKKMATTFKILCDMADWSTPLGDSGIPVLEESRPVVESQPVAVPSNLNLHHDIHIHLPSTSDTAVYTAIFRALRAELVD